MALTLDVNTGAVSSALWADEGEFFEVLENLAGRASLDGKPDRGIAKFAAAVAMYHSGSTAAEMIPAFLRALADAIEAEGNAA